MADLRIGFVGTGSMGQCAHLCNFKRIDGCRVTAIAELRPQLAERVAARYDVPNVYRHHTEMLEAQDLDGIVASQPFTRHGTLVPELLGAGVPVMIEKPLAGSVDAARNIVAALEGTDTWLMVGYHKRSDPAVVRAVREIRSLRETGRLGPMRYVRILMPAGDWIAGGFRDLIGTGETAPDLESDPPPAGMGDEEYREYLAFVNYYIHQVNLMRYLLGEPFCVTYADPTGVVLAVQSESGTPGVIEMTPYHTSLDWEESVLIAFAHGYITLRLPPPLAVNRAGTVELYSDPPGDDVSGPVRTVPSLPHTHAMLQQAMHFVQAIRGEIPPPCEAREAIDDLVVAREYIRLKRAGRDAPPCR